MKKMKKQSIWKVNLKKKVVNGPIWYRRRSNGAHFRTESTVAPLPPSDAGEQAICEGVVIIQEIVRLFSISIFVNLSSFKVN